MNRSLIRPTLALLAAFWLALAIGAPARANEPSYLEPYAALLHAHVVMGEKDGIQSALVDYQRWAADPNHAEAVRRLLATNPATLDGAAKTAFWINAYNLLIIDLIIRQNEQETIENVGSVLDDPERSFTWDIYGTAVTLDQIARDKLQTRHDPRLHFALANARLSGPDLALEPYRGETLNDQLNQHVQQFLRNPTKGLYARGTVLEISALFKRYKSNFLLHGGTESFLQQHRPDLPANATIYGYFPVNSSLNGGW